MSITTDLARREVGLNRKRRPGTLAHLFPRTWNKRRRMQDVAVSRSTQTTKDGAEQVGQGLQVTVPRAVPHLYNNNYTVRLTYADNFRHDVSYSAGRNQIFRTNSIFDPDYSLTGHQPIMRDLWASQYDYYAVLSCDYTIRMYNASGQDPITYTSAGTSGQTLGAVNVTVIPTTNDADINSATTSLVYPAAEMKNARTDWLIPGAECEFAGTLTPGDYIVDAKDSDSDTTWTANGSNPAVPRYLGYVLSLAQPSVIIGQNEQQWAAIQVQVILHYTVQFTQVNASLRGTSS